MATFKWHKNYAILFYLLVVLLMQFFISLLEITKKNLHDPFRSTKFIDSLYKVHNYQISTDTPYAGGVFRVRLALGREFPAAPPRAYFLTKIFHPNVSAAGEVCVNTLKRDWRPELGLAHALLAVRCLLIAPNADSALNAEAAALLRDRYDDYFARAKLYTDIHARPDHAQHAHAHKQEYRDVEEHAEEGGEARAEGADGGEGAPRPKRERRAAAARDSRRILKRL